MGRLSRLGETRGDWLTPHCVVCGRLEPDPPSHRPSDFKELVFAKGRWWCKAHVSESSKIPRRNIDYSKLRTETVEVRMPLDAARELVAKTQLDDSVTLDTVLDKVVAG